MSSRAAQRLKLGVGLALLLAAVGAVSFSRAAGLRKDGAPQFDFSHFYLDAHYVWTHGELDPDPAQRALPFYLPVVALLLSPIAAAGVPLAAAVWTVVQLAALTACLGLLWRWCASASDPPGPAVRMTIVVLLALPAIYETAKFNQPSFVVLALVLGAFAALQRRRRVLGGSLLAAAAVFKLLPAIFVVWLILKREWGALGAFTLAAALLALGPCLIAFGPQDTRAYHRQWVEHNIRGAPVQGMVDPQLAEHFTDRRNQSIAAVCARVFWPGHRTPAPWRPLTLSENACAWIARIAAAALLAALMWGTRRAGRRLAAPRLRAEVGLYLLGMLVLAPLVRQYYLVWALPALALLAQLGGPSAPRRARIFALSGLAVWLAGMFAWLSPLARVYGAHLFMLIALGVLLWLAARAATPDVDSQRPSV